MADEKVVSPVISINQTKFLNQYGSCMELYGISDHGQVIFKCVTLSDLHIYYKCLTDITNVIVKLASDMVTGEVVVNPVNI